MKIGDLDQCCGECKVIDYCAEPYSELCLCTDERLAEIEEDKYVELAEKSCKSENKDICDEVAAIIKV